MRFLAAGVLRSMSNILPPIKHARIYTLRTLHLAHLLWPLALVDQAAVAALILPPNNIELAGGVPEPRAGAAGTADARPSPSRHSACGSEI